MSGNGRPDGVLAFGGALRSRPGVQVHLGVDATAVGPEQRGLGRFQEQLAGRLADRDDVRVTTLVSRHGNGAMPGGRAVAGRLQVTRDLLGVPAAIRGAGPEVFLTTTDRLRAPRGLPVVLYVFEHPVYRHRMARLASTSARRRLADTLTTGWFGRTLARADRIVASSTSTARDLVFLEGVPCEKLSVVPPGPLLDVARSTTPRRPHVLAFIDRDIRDNGRAVIAACRDLPTPWELHVVGDAPAEVADAGRTALRERFRLHGRVDDAALRQLYAEAGAYLDLSLYEGFGSQAAEAAHAGVPCIVSAFTSLPEVVGAGALVVDPHRPETASAALARVAAGAAPAPAPRADQWATLVDHLIALSQSLL